MEEVKKLQNRIKILDRRWKEIQDEREKTILYLQEICLHKNTRQDKNHHSGGYDYTGWTDYGVICLDCNKIIKRWRKDWNTYG